MRSFGIVALMILLAEGFCLVKSAKELAVKKFVSKRAIEALGVAVFPGSARFGGPGVNVEVRQLLS